ncbi:MAG: M48 family metalloprotease, partial [Phycisphaerales bacterium]
SSAYMLFYEGLLQRIEDEGELDAAVAHEVSHIINRDCAIATALNLVTLMAQLMVFLGRAVLSLGAGFGGCMVELASVFASGGVVGLIIGLGIICMLLMAMVYAVFFAAIAFALFFIALLAVNAFQRQRECLADEFAAAVVGRTQVARVLIKVASSDPQDRMMLGQFIGFDAGGEEAIPEKEVLDGIRATKPRFAVAARLAELLSDHPLGLRRIYSVLVGSEKPGFFNSLIGWFSGTIENRASWLTMEVATQERSTREREAPTVMLAAIVGFAAAVLMAVSPAGANVVIPLAVGLSLGLVLGAGTAWILVRRGPFLGTDVVDAIVTGTTVWFISEEVFSTILVLPSDLAYLTVIAVVFVINAIVSVLGYTSLPPTGLYAEGPAIVPSESLRPNAPPHPPRAPKNGAAGSTISPLPTGLAAQAPSADQKEEDMVILEPAEPSADREGGVNDDAFLFDRDYDD